VSDLVLAAEGDVRAESVCVLGAGPSGITAAKNLLEAGFSNLVVYDRGDRVGGNWVFDDSQGHSSVFETTHIISSKGFSQYEDYPAPDTWPDYPSHTELAAYFQAYARHFGVEEHVRFGRLVTRCARRPEGGWLVTTVPSADPAGPAETAAFDRLVVCNGHHWKPRWPEYPGTFTGSFLHSHQFKRAAPFSGQRVLVPWRSAASPSGPTCRGDAGTGSCRSSCSDFPVTTSTSGSPRGSRSSRSPGGCGPCSGSCAW
jgi:cation diffusion facilitator CzcD-associated flavoprotein CzcO